ncbi:hypothetical protein ACIRTW_12760 [Pseudomonas aeruginosa]|nr:hypothetical protein [Pseudomonas aeruginosa]EZO07527.1 hypothetical protein AJ64_02294 [Pseudomonas aeruginosa 3577]TSC39103.1 hypothetical protein FN974_30160 [Pseudomonas aeruginosa]WCU66597.1 hypothetical protein KKY60_11905 [Pseudomonas aeruginosa]HBO2301198.1 hypothetical protein [Pseudomonas aeruginosa]
MTGDTEAKMDISNIKYTYKLSTVEHSGCPFCRQSFGVALDWDINHLLQSHGGVLLHVGSQSLNSEGEPPYYSQVALVGFETEPPAREPSAVFSTQIPPKQ